MIFSGFEARFASNGEQIGVHDLCDALIAAGTTSKLLTAARTWKASGGGANATIAGDASPPMSGWSSLRALVASPSSPG